MKKKRSIKKKHASDSSVEKGSLEEQALFQVNSCHFKEAIALYKKLLQTSESNKWRQQLAFCYLQRALSFADRGMHKEALVLWENYSQHSSAPYEAFDQYIFWVIQTKNKEKIQSVLNTLSITQLDSHYPVLASFLGQLLLTQNPEFQNYLPQNSALVTQFKMIQTALSTDQENELGKLNETLKQLPFRSAFRDFRTLIKAAIAAQISIEQMQVLLAKIPDSSPYQKTAKLMQACSADGIELTQELTQFSHKERRIISQAKGLGKQQSQLIEQINRQKERLTYKAKFNLALQFKDLFGIEQARLYCLNTVIDHSFGQKDFNKNFSSSSKFEDNRLRALAAEKEADLHDNEYFWRNCIEVLTEAEGVDNDLKIALILRQIAQQYTPADQTSLLIESLNHDPEAHGCYLQILKNFSQQPEAEKDYKHWLKVTLKKFPKDVSVLTIAINTAIRNKANKKACQYASKLLKIDPINTFAKQALFSSHLAHAKWLIRAKKYHLVEAEIQQAENLKIDKVHSIQARLLQGFFCFVNQDKEQGKQIITESINQLHSDPVNAYFHAAMETLLFELPVAPILRELKPAKEHLLSSSGLTELVKQLRQYSEQDDRHEKLHKAIEKIKSALKKSLSRQDYDEKIVLDLCQTLDKIEHYELLRYCAKLSVTKWKKPVWVYYRVYSECNGRADQCSYLNLLQLQTNQKIAMDENDHRALVLIDKFLNLYYQAESDYIPGGIEDLFGIDEHDDSVDDLFAHLSDEVFLKVNHEMKSLIKRTSPEKLALKLVSNYRDSEKLLQAMMEDPEVFTALIVVYTANQAGIDINVTIDDVVDCFGLNKLSSPLPFPF